MFGVEIIYQNIESGGKGRFRWQRNIEAKDAVEAHKKALKKIGSNVDGRVFQTTVVEIFVEKD